MGDLQACIPLSNGRIGDYNPPPSPLQPTNPHPSTITRECWRKSEQATQEIIHGIQPTLASEQRRRAVVEYVQRLIRVHCGTQVFPFGSVPLKTYLPDGDIDLTTTLVAQSSEDRLSTDVFSIIKGEEKNSEAKFEVKDVQYINAEVKIVKCLVQNIAVDISFNQIGGLCTLCFLEQVDQHIGKNNLFKRSIILIKAWCYYESRILGAHHGLISTYGLETLVLYVFHLFHSSLNGPLAVLYRFLDYFSKFDWDNYCVSLQGPISLSTLPELVAEAPENDGGDLLLSMEFLRSSVNKFSDPPKVLENNSRSFLRKHLNILDPLKENNNLGRSVSRGNFYRIRSAFTYGARKLGRILLLPADSISHEINTFFMNTLERHGSGERPDVQDVRPRCPVSTVMDRSEGRLYGGINKINSSSSDMVNGIGAQLGRQLSNMKVEENGLIEGDYVSIDKGKVGTNRASPANSQMLASLPTRAYRVPHLYFSGHEYGYEDGISPEDFFGPNDETSPFVVDSYDAESSWYNNLGLSASSVSNDVLAASSLSTDQSEYPQISVGSSLARKEGAGSTKAPPKLNNHLGDLTGDYGMHFRSLSYVRLCRDFPVRMPSQYRNEYSWDAAQPHGMYPQMNANGMIPRPNFVPRVFYPMNPTFFPVAYSMEETPRTRGTGTYFPNTAHRPRERQSPGRVSCPVANQLQRPRSDGHIWVVPEMNYTEKSSRDPPLLQQNPVPGGNNHVNLAVNQLQRPRSDGRIWVVPEMNYTEKSSQDPPLQQQNPVPGGNDHVNPAANQLQRPCSDDRVWVVPEMNYTEKSSQDPPLQQQNPVPAPKSPQTGSKGFPYANGSSHYSDRKAEFGSHSAVQVGTSSQEVGKKMESISSNQQEPATSSTQERPRKMYQVKYEDDFPPLT